MALTAVVAGNDIFVADLNQIINCLTGVMTDQPVTFGNTLAANDGVKLGSGGPGAGPDIHADGTNIYVETNGAGTVHLRPNGYGSDTNAATYDSAGHLTVAGALTAGAAGVASLASSGAVSGTTGTFSAAVSGTSGTFTGAVQSNSHPVVEGTSAVSHAEVYPAQGSTSLASNATVSFTLTFARAFAGNPAVSASAMNGGAIIPNARWQPSAISTSSVTFVFMNTDGNPQTMSNFSISALGA